MGQIDLLMRLDCFNWSSLQLQSTWTQRGCEIKTTQSCYQLKFQILKSKLRLIFSLISTAVPYQEYILLYLCKPSKLKVGPRPSANFPFDLNNHLHVVLFNKFALQDDVFRSNISNLSKQLYDRDLIVWLLLQGTVIKSFINLKRDTYIQKN